jgi:hypothetical protein
MTHAFYDVLNIRLIYIAVDQYSYGWDCTREPKSFRVQYKSMDYGGIVWHSQDIQIVY